MKTFFCAMFLCMVSMPVFAEGITVNGVGSVEATPDMVYLSVSVGVQERTAKQSMEVCATKVDELFSAMSEYTDEKDVKTTRFSMNPVYRHDRATDKSVFVGYSTVQHFRIAFRDCIDESGRTNENFGNALDKLTGITYRINSVQFDVSNRKQLEETAWKLAIDDAKFKASIFAAQSGVDLGAPISIDGISYTPMLRPAMVQESPYDGRAKMGMSSGSEMISVNVSMQFTID